MPRSVELLWTRLLQSILQFVSELKRRKVYHVAVAYAAVSFVIIQVADLLVPAFGIPPWGYRFVVLLCLLGFPIALVLAWAFEITAEGVRVTPASPSRVAEDADADSPAAGTTGQGAGALVVVGLAIAVVAGYALLGRGDGDAGRIDVGDRSLAVLPFEPIGQDEPSPFIDGIHDDLLTRLSSIHGFRVIARSSVDRYRGSDKSSATIAQELGVRWILEGGVQQTANEVKVNARLVDPRTAAQAWSQSYLMPLSAESLFAIQADITRQIASELEIQLTPREAEAAQSRPTENLAAYRLLIEARTLLAQREEAAMRRGLALFRRAVEIDEQLAPAWAGIADSIGELLDYGFEMPAGALEIAESAARRAIAIDPQLPEAQLALGLVHLMRQNGPEALEYIELAARMRPNGADAHSKISWAGQLLGQTELAFSAARRALEFDPLAVEPRVNLAMGHVIRGEATEALSVVRAKRDLLPLWPTLDFYEAVILQHLGRHDEALALLDGLTVTWAGVGPAAARAISYAATGRPERAREELAAMRSDGAHPFLVGLAEVALGDIEQGFAAFAEARSWDTDSDWANLAARYLYPEQLGGLRSDPRYLEMIESLDRAWGMSAVKRRP